jgi:hypothetical protein
MIESVLKLFFGTKSNKKPEPQQVKLATEEPSEPSPYEKWFGPSRVADALIPLESTPVRYYSEEEDYE